MKTLLFILLGVFSLAVQSAEFNFENSTFYINAKSYIWYASTDEGSRKSTTLSDGGEETEVEFKFKRETAKGYRIFGEIELESNVFSDSDDDGDISSDDIVLGISHKKYGQISISKNNDDPFEKYVAEGIEELAAFASVSEAETAASNKNQIQYKSPNYNGFNIILGWGQDSGIDNDNDNAEIAYVLTYEGGYDGDTFGFALGQGETDMRDDAGNYKNTGQTSGLHIWYKTAATKFILVAITEDHSDKDYNGFGIAHQFNKEQALNFAYQQVKEQGEANRDEIMLSYQQQIFEGVTVYGEVVKFDKINNADDALGIGIEFLF